jgi:hypothetical protein
MTSPPGTGLIPQVIPAPGSRLEQLLDMRESARAAAKDAQDRLDAIDAGIKAEVAATGPGQAAFDIAGSPHRAPLRLRYHAGTWYVPVGPLRARHPDVWSELKQQKRGYWQLHDLDRT